MSEEVYHLIETQTAEEFMEALNPLRLPEDCRDDMIYRGQSNSDWKLTPSLFRDGIFGITPGWSSNKTLRYEIIILDTFIRNLGKINLTDYRVGNFSEEIRKISAKLKQNNMKIHFRAKYPSDLYEHFSYENWPDIGALEIMALAQHSGLPTRLLDWTYSPYVAAYFSAFSSIDTDINKNHKISVWSVNKTYTNNINQKSNVSLSDLYRLEPPFLGSNPNAIAQSGCFLFIKESISGEDFEKIHLDEYIKNKIITEKIGISTERFFQKTTVPATEAEKILRLCGLFGISYSKLFRSYEGCATELKIDLPDIKFFINNSYFST